MAQKTGEANMRRGQRQETESELERSPGRIGGLSRRDPFEASFSPLGMMRRMQEDMDRLFGSFGFGRSAWPAGPEMSEWAPALDVFQRDNELVVRADVPGLSREDLAVEVGDDALTIRGERKYDHEEDREGMFRRERGYGAFCRVVSLPEGVMPDTAKASFKNGVLEVTMQSPPQEVRRGRQIEIGEGEKK